MSISYDDVKMNDYIDNVIVDAGNISLIADLNIENDALSGPTDMIIRDIKFADTDTAKDMTIDEINLSAEYDGLDILALAQGNMNLDMKKIGGMKLKAEIKDIESGFKLSKMMFEFDGKKPENGYSDQTLKIKYDGLEPSDTKDKMIKFAPKSMDFDFDVNKFPVADLLALGLMKAAENDTPAAAMNMLQSITSLPTKMANAGSHIKIQNFDFANDMYQIKTQGKIAASDKSPIMVVGGLILEANGLDKTKNALNELTAETTPKQQKSIQNIMKRINFIETNCDGQDGNYKCNLEIPEDGQIKLNGKPMSPMEAIQAVQ
jgi:hypothetical protein